MLEEVLAHYRTSAENIPNYKKINKNDLVNTYLSCTNETEKNWYMSAIICRYWQMLL